MEAFLANLKVILPVVGLDLLKRRVRAPTPNQESQVNTGEFEIRHKSVKLSETLATLTPIATTPS